MRVLGTLTKWNDDRGFGFITPAKGTADIFVHISAFPRDGGRPRLNELISFETAPGPDGRQRAVRIMRPMQQTSGRFAAPRDPRPHHGRKLGGALTLLIVAAIGAYGYSRFAKHVEPAVDATSDEPQQLASPSARYSCDGRTMCSQMTSCPEAEYFIRHCQNTRMDGDGDGVPCESQWCKSTQQ